MNTTLTQYNAMASVQAQEAALSELQPSVDTYQQLQEDLSSESTVSRWRLLLAIVAYHIKTLRDLWDMYVVDVLALAKDGHYGTRRWFVARALAFQWGHVLQLTPKDAFYAADDAAARIVKRAACIELGNRVIVKVAKAQGNGLTKLLPAEQSAVQQYFNVLRPPVQVSVLTADADKLRMYGVVVFDPQYILAVVQSNVLTSVRQYLRNLEFGGSLRITDLKNAMLAVPGVVDVRHDSVQCRSSGSWIVVPRVYTSYAGHMDLDMAFPLTSTLNWAVGSL